MASAIAALPGLPFDPQLADALSDQYPHANDFDRNVREAMRDQSKAALDHIAGCILQVARDLSNESNLTGAGFRLADGVKRLNEARSDARLPDFAGVGPLLPDELDGLVTFCARLLIARGRGLIKSYEIQASSPAEIESRIAAIMMESGEHSIAALTQRLAEHGVALQDAAVSVWTDAPDPLVAIQVSGAVRVESWQAAEEAVREWSIAEKESAGFATRATLATVASGTIIQIGINIWNATAGFTLATQPDFERVANALQHPLLPTIYQELADELLQNLVTASSNMVRSEKRPPDWPTKIAPTRLTNVDLRAGDPAPWETALDTYRELRDRVLTQTPGDTLAGAVSNLAPSVSTQSPLIELVANLRLAAMDADLAGSS
ncbi:hypothetical protein ACL9RL_02660 [Plantibacter sp. Mn2098]|uniref:hypothetical protein n=1 Tax=Plantibacter sp. Mn2098 TaxID=3395266 RepID=UPI003BC0F385